MVKTNEKTEKNKNNLLDKLKTKNQKGTKLGISDKSALWGKIGLTLGLVSIGAWFIPVLGVLVSMAGLIFNILGLKVDKGRWFAVVGLTLSIVFLNMSFIYGFYNVLVSMLGNFGV